jgi:hypothetical protein
VPIFARRGELGSQADLIRMLSQQMRERVESKIDVGVLSLVRTFQRRPKHLRMVLEHLIRRGHSLWYAYFGATDLRGGMLLGREVETIRYIGPTWAPMGISLLANQFRGRLLFQATYDPELVPDEMADRFLDTVWADLRNLTH